MRRNHRIALRYGVLYHGKNENVTTFIRYSQDGHHERNDAINMPLMALLARSCGPSQFFTKNAVRRRPILPFFQLSGRGGCRSPENAGCEISQFFTINQPDMTIRRLCKACSLPPLFPPIRAILSFRRGSESRSMVPEQPRRTSDDTHTRN